MSLDLKLDEPCTGTLYIDAQGKLWRVTAFYDSPTVEMVEVEQEVGVLRARLFGSTAGAMWDGFKRLVPRQ